MQCRLEAFSIPDRLGRQCSSLRVSNVMIFSSLTLPAVIGIYMASRKFLFGPEFRCRSGKNSNV